MRTDHDQPFDRGDPGLGIGVVAGGVDQRRHGIRGADVSEGLEIPGPHLEDRLVHKRCDQRRHGQRVGDFPDRFGSPVGRGRLVELPSQPLELWGPLFLGQGGGRVPLEQFDLLRCPPGALVANEAQGGHPLSRRQGGVVGSKAARERDRDQQDRRQAGRPGTAARRRRRHETDYTSNKPAAGRRVQRRFLTPPPASGRKPARRKSPDSPPPMKAHWPSVAIVGVGLIGGSIGRALLARRLARRVIGVGRTQGSLDAARRAGAITETSLDPAAVAEADLVIVATGVRSIPRLLEAVDAAVRPGTPITDAGSTKASIVAAWEKRRKIRRGRFVGSHPLAGSHRRGPACARHSAGGCRRRGGGLGGSWRDGVCDEPSGA